MNDNLKSFGISFFAVIAGILITIIDSNPSWDDTGITAAMIFGISGLLGYISPKRPWLHALLVSAWIPLYGI